MTSLADQLQRLAVPETSTLKRGKTRASILFDAKEAAGLKRDTFYEIGVEGIEELVEKNVLFAKFKSTLFHISSKDFERSVQSAEANEKLNQVIKQFFLILSPYFMLNCAHKALEWLVNRYSIHEYNRDDFLMLILPYHESNIFVRIVQIMNFKDSDSFYFLQTLQKPGVHLTKQSLLNFAANNSGFLKLVTKHILQLVNCYKNSQVLTTAYNFYCTIFAGTIEYSSKVTEDQVTQMLPSLLKGLNSQNADFCAASYVITAKLITKTNLSDKLLNKLIERISEISIIGLKTEAILVLVLIYQSQKQYNSMSRGAVENLLEKDWLPNVLEQLNQSGSFIEPFLRTLMDKSVEDAVKNDSAVAREFVNNSLKEIKFDEGFIPVFLQFYLTR